MIGYPTVPITKEADKIRPAPADLLKADGQDPPFRLLFVGYTPSQIDFGKCDGPHFANFAQLRKRSLDEFLALRLHVAKGRRHKNANNAGRG